MRVIPSSSSQLYPTRQSYVYASFWDASPFHNGNWAGRRTADTYNNSEWSLEAGYQHMKVHTPLLQ